MKVPITYLSSADRSPWTESVAKSDLLPARPSGPWIDTKHKLLTYYADLFATGMKNKWSSRVYLELFSGPGKRVTALPPRRRWGSTGMWREI